MMNLHGLSKRRVNATCVVMLGVSLLAITGCNGSRRHIGLIKEKEALERMTDRMLRELAAKDAQIDQLEGQVASLQSFDPKRPADLFAPVKLEIVSLSRGADYDGVPGDDGVTVYLRPRDTDGDAVKAAGSITIQLIDNTDLPAPTVVGVYEFDDPQALRALWHGRFGTDHYSLKCPFPDGYRPSASRRLTVSARFVDFLTGATLTAVKEVDVSFPNS